MKVQQVPVTQVLPYDGNPRRNEAAVAKVAASLQEFGWRQPIVVDEAFVVIAGHTRLLAAISLNMKTVPVHVATGLSKSKVRAYRLADNRTGEEAEWDTAKLVAELVALQGEGADLSTTGFDEQEIAALLADPGGLLPDADPDAVPEMPPVPSTVLGDVYQLGAHRLVCGDATDTHAWSAVMGDDRAALVWTDPPYGVAYVGKTKAKMTIQNDALDTDELADLLRGALGLASAHCTPGAPWYVAAPHGPAFLAFAQVGVELGWWRQTLVWVKDAFALGHSDHHYRHEAILVGNEPDREAYEHQVIGYGWDCTGPHAWHGGRRQDTVWEVPRPRANRMHPTMKPVELIERCLNNSSVKGAIVVDPFGGSGSTLVACEVAGRVARLIELDPRYCDVIVRRWEEATGRTAERVLRRVDEAA